MATLIIKIPPYLPLLKGGIMSLFGITPPPSAPPLKIRGGRGSYDP
jgi:hypothetical protein